MHSSDIAHKAHTAAIRLAGLDSAVKNRALSNIIDGLEKRRDEIAAANRADLLRSEKEQLAAPLLKRLRFNAEKLEEVVTGIRALIELPDPIGEVLEARELSEGLNLYKVRCPIGVIAMIFESRPDAAVQIATLALKSGNAVLLKGGREARETVNVLCSIIHDEAVRAGFPEGWVGVLETREEVSEILTLDQYINLIIPRGSNEFVQHIMRNSNIPVLGHADGICHQYIHSDADTQMAVELAVDSKTQYVAVCNAMETLLIHSDAAQRILPVIAEKMAEKSVELRGCPRTGEILRQITPAAEEDWSTEYLDYILSIKVVDSLEDAVEHINRYGSGHTDGIITADPGAARRFISSVDSASALWNCSTRFADGFRYGLGAEVGISTHKIHARGPVGMDGLTIYQWQAMGQGQTVGEFSDGRRSYTHKPIDTAGYPFHGKGK